MEQLAETQYRVLHADWEFAFQVLKAGSDEPENLTGSTSVLRVCEALTLRSGLYDFGELVAAVVAADIDLEVGQRSATIGKALQVTGQATPKLYICDVTTTWSSGSRKVIRPKFKLVVSPSSEAAHPGTPAP